MFVYRHLNKTREELEKIGQRFVGTRMTSSIGATLLPNCLKISGYEIIEEPDGKFTIKFPMIKVVNPKYAELKAEAEK